LNYTKQTIK